MPAAAAVAIPRRPRALGVCALLLGALLLGGPPAPAAPGGAPADVARAFYDAFCKGDTATMEALYAPGVQFHDEIFDFPDRAGTMGMWRVLTDPASGGRFTYSVLGVKGDVVTVKWLADYKFPSKDFGRPVHNEVTATLVVRNGRIVKHTDRFSWEKWSRQALPFGGLSSWGPAASAIKWAIRTALAHSAASKPPAAPSGPGVIDRLSGSK